MAVLQRGRNAIAQSPEVSDIRVLTRADLAVLAEPRPAGRLKALRDNHHRIARAIASGLSNNEVAEICGISVGRVSIHRNDPAMIELVAHYRSLTTEEWVKTSDPVNDFMRSIRTKTLAQVEETLINAEENNEVLPARTLVQFAELTLDRSGYGKVNKNINVNVDFAAALEAARKRSAEARQPKQIEANHAQPPVNSPRSVPISSPPLRSVPPIPSSLRRL